MYIDIHAHLFHEAFENPDGAVQRATENDVTTIVNNGLDYETNQASLSIAERHESCEAASGVYPGRLHDIDEDELEAIFDQMHRDDTIAIGEVGLDYRYADTTEQKQRQRAVFKQCVMLGKALRKPLIIHSRNAEKDTVKILEELNAYAPILHAFTGRKHIWRRGLRNGYYFSIPPVATRAQQFQQLIEDAKTHQLFTESDAPYLAAKSGERSEPSLVKETVSLINDVKDIDCAASSIQHSYRRIFDTYTPRNNRYRSKTY